MEEGLGAINLFSCQVDVCNPCCLFVQENTQIFYGVSIVQYVSVNGIRDLYQ